MSFLQRHSVGIVEFFGVWIAVILIYNALDYGFGVEAAWYWWLVLSAGVGLFIGVLRGS